MTSPAPGAGAPGGAASPHARSRGLIAALLLGCALLVGALTLITRLTAPGIRYGGAAASPDLLILLLALGLCLLLSRRWPAPARALAIVASALWMLVVTAQVQVLLQTGNYASRPLVAYVARNLGDTGAIAWSGVNVLFLAMLGGAAALLLLVARSSELHAAMDSRLGRGATIALALLIAVAAYFLPHTGGAIGNALSASGFGRGLPPVAAPASAYVAPAVTPAPDAERPHVILWIIESARPDLIGTGAMAAHAPFLNDLAARSRRFDRAYTTTLHTSKALVGLLCGTFPATWMEITEAEPGGMPATCLPRLMADLGYRTRYLQSADGSFENRVGLVGNFGFAQVQTRQDLDPAFARAGYFGMDEFALLAPFEQALQAPQDAPLFLTLLTVLTHHPYAMPGERLPTLEPAAAYERVLEHTDRFFAEAYARIGRHLDWNNTVLIVAGDHGQAFGEHGRFQHGLVTYEEAVRTPLLIHAPGRVPAGVDAELRQHVDLLPTVLALAGARWTGSLPGASLLAPSPHPHVVATCWYTDSCHALIRADGGKLHFWFGSDLEELYALPSDPLERRDLAGEPDSERRIFDGMVAIAAQRAYANAPYLARREAPAAPP